MLLEQALALSSVERELLVDELKASLGDHEPSAEWAAAWTAECDRRMADMDAGRTKPVLWEEVEERLFNRANAR